MRPFVCLAALAVLGHVAHADDGAPAPSAPPPLPPTVAFAEPTWQPPAPEKPFDPTATITTEPIFLVIGLVEANVEIKVAPHVGLQVIGGYGRIAGIATIKELGSEVNVYARPQLAGFHAGALAKFTWGGLSYPFSSLDNMDSGDSKERELGAYVGWKWIGWHHLTAVVQAGVGKLDLSNTAPSSDAPAHQLIPVANFTAGYAF